jgi:preprotein translocase subunit YajC
MGDVVTLVVLALPIAGIWLLVIKPAQRRARATAELSAGLQVGQKVMTTGGLYGTIADIDDDMVQLTVADGVTLRFARRAVAVVESDQAPDKSHDRTDLGN